MELNSEIIKESSSENNPSVIPIQNDTKAFTKFKIFLAMFDLCMYYCFCFRVQKFRSDVLICDRYIIDSIIDLSVHYPNLDIEESYGYLIRLIPKPDYSILLIIDENEQKKRMNERGESPSKNASIVNDKYCDNAKKFGLVLNGKESIESLHNEIVKHINLD